MKGTVIRFLKIGCYCTLIITSLILHSCLNSFYSRRELAYYSKESNYIKVTGTIRGVYQYEKDSELVFSCDDLSARFSAPYFKVNGKNYSVVIDKDILGKLKEGIQVEFITAQEFFYDGYQMPVVQLSVDGEELLSYEEGYQNLIEWLKGGGY